MSAIKFSGIEASLCGVLNSKIAAMTLFLAPKMAWSLAFPLLLKRQNGDTMDSQNTFKKFVGKTIRLMGCLVFFIACSDDKQDAPAPEETKASMLQVLAQPMGPCPDISGQYTCGEKSAANDENTVNIILRSEKANSYHLAFIDSKAEEDQSYFMRRIENYIMDDGGFLISGEVQDKAALARELAKGILDPQLINDLRLAYVGYCAGNRLTLHYVLGNTAFKSKITKNADDSITQTLFQLTEEGTVKKETGVCTKSKATALAPDARELEARTRGAQKIAEYPSEILVQLAEAKAPAFAEPITIKFDRYGRLFSRHLYVFNKSFLGPVDNRALLWWLPGDDVSWVTPWKSISLDLKKMLAFGGSEAGVGAPFADVHYDGKKFTLQLRVPYTVDVSEQQISVIPPKDFAADTSNVDCPAAVRFANMCEIYSGVFGTLSAIDFSSLGEVAPLVASDVVSVSTAFSLSKSVLIFKPSVDQIRDNYLLPALSAIGKVKALKKIDRNNKTLYLDKTREAYSNLIITAVDVTFKTHTLVPEMTEEFIKETFGANLKQSLGLVLSYLGAHRMGQKLSGQPAWVGELITPAAKNFLMLSLDLVFNNSNSSFMERIERFLSMEEQLKTIIVKLCDKSPTNGKNECLSALNQ